MASPPHPSTMENLPPELLSNIFLRLFAKQLAQMRSVSKSWNAFLSESAFIKSHLHGSINKNPIDKILLVFSQGFSFRSKPFTAHPSRSPDIKLTDFIKSRPRVKPQSEFSGCRVVGSVNGLICFSSVNFPDNSPFPDTSFHIWNPSLSAMVTLPPAFHMPSTLRSNVYIRFGFDPKSDDYKVVKISGLHRRPSASYTLASLLDSFSDPREHNPHAEIYSMRKGSWQVITERFPSHITWIEELGEVIVDGRDGYLHCLCSSDLKGKQQVILAVNLGDETFFEMHLPDCTVNSNAARINVLGRLGANLCLMSTGVDGGFEIWVMEEYGMSESWVKYRSFPKLRNIVLYGFSSHLQFCFQAKKGLFLCAPPFAKIKRFGVFAKYDDKYKIVEYNDSLVWVEPVKCENSCSNKSPVQVCKWVVHL